jgi:DNA repair and recombination protein RAD54B
LQNWKREFRKWLGTSSINVLCIDGDKRSSVKSFLYSKTYSVMIIGYEKLRTCMNELKDAQPPIDLIVCDEGHRLKSKDAKTTKMFEALSTPRRVILSGTPIQNDLSEFYAMVDFVCPGLLGDRNTFKKVFEDPIMKSRVQHCRKEDLENGKHRSEMVGACDIFRLCDHAC